MVFKGFYKNQLLRNRQLKWSSLIWNHTHVLCITPFDGEILSSFTQTKTLVTLFSFFVICVSFWHVLSPFHSFNSSLNHFELKETETHRHKIHLIFYIFLLSMQCVKPIKHFKKDRTTFLTTLINKYLLCNIITLMGQVKLSIKSPMHLNFIYISPRKQKRSLYVIAHSHSYSSHWSDLFCVL